MKAELLSWFRKLRSISQYGLTYSKDPFDRERFQAVQAIATEIACTLVSGSHAEVERTLEAELSVPTPKLDVRAAVFDGDTILLVRESSDSLWSLPGGWVDVDESPSHAAERETKEESGYDCKARKLIAVWDRNRHPHPPMLLHVYKLFFLCDLRGGAATPSHETSQVGFFALNELPALSTARVLREQIECAFRHRARPELATEFD
jgi:ADP-ribose pyrophosphatase YjhB (NUDIX family)